MQRVNTIWFGILSLLFQSSALASGSRLACDDIVTSKTDVARLDGHDDNPLPKYPEVYTGGFKVSFTLSPKATSASDILVNELRLEVRAFSPGSRPEYSYKIGEVYGAGPATPRRFRVTLNGKEISRATWIKGNSGIVANSGNFLDTNDPAFQAFKLAATKPAKIEGTVLAFKAGVYDLVWRLGYQTNAGAAGCVLATVRVYQDRDD